jgi:hypothetical protein
MRRFALATVMTVALPAALGAQRGAVGVQAVFGDYRETSANLHYRGSGGGVAGSFSWRRFTIAGAFASVQYDSADGSSATAPFKATQLDVRLGYPLTGPVSAELGFMNRKVDPEFEAQSVGAVTAGLRMAYPLGPGVNMGLRGGLMFAPKFSGGGKASPIGALELGLALGVDALRGRLRVTGDYDFQRISRKTDGGSGAVRVPIQQSLGRVGIAVVF